MTERAMTEKGFIKKASGKVSAAAFISQHRDFLTTGTLAHFTTPILTKLDAGELLPTPALVEIKAAVWSHFAASTILKAEKSLEKSTRERKEKPYVVTILDAKGNTCTKLNSEGDEVDLIQGFESDGEAHGWADRRLFEGASDWRATIVATKLNNLTVHILRDDAVARIMKQPKPCATRKTGTSSGKLGFGVKCSNDRSRFSSG